MLGPQGKCLISRVNSRIGPGSCLAEVAAGNPTLRQIILKTTFLPALRPKSGQGVPGPRPGPGSAAHDGAGRVKFTPLLHHVTIDLLRYSFGSLTRRAATEADGMTCERICTRWLCAA